MATEPDRGHRQASDEAAAARMPASQAVATPSRRLRWAAALLTALIGLGASLIGLGRSLAANDDNLWLAAVVNAPSAGSLRTIETQAIDQIRTETGKAPVRYEKRREYGANYAGAIMVWRAAASRFFPEAARPEASAKALSRRLIVMFIAGLALAWTLFGVALARVDDARVVRGTLVGITLAALWFSLMPLQFSQTLGAERGLVHLLPETLMLLLRPHDALSVFGFTGRNLFGVLFAAAFALRWANHPRLSVALLVPATLAHASYLTMMLPFLVACDAMNRRSNLRDPIYVGVLILLTLYAVSGETLWRTLLRAEPWLFAVLGLLLAATLGWMSRLPLPTLTRFSTIGRDVAVLGAAWILTLPIAVLMSRIADPQTSSYFWVQIHPRTMGVLQPVLAIALGCWLLGGDNGGRVVRAICATLAFVLPIGGLHALFSPDGALPRLEREHAKLKRELDEFREAGGQHLARRGEAFTYYAIERTLAGVPGIGQPRR